MEENFDMEDRKWVILEVLMKEKKDFNFLKNYVNTNNFIISEILDELLSRRLITLRRKYYQITEGGELFYKRKKEELLLNG